MSIQETFLSLVPQLSHIPEDWEDQQFYFANTTHGILCILVEGAEQAEDACLVYFGRASQCSLRRNDEGVPISSEVPMNWLGPCQYLDATLILHGDPARICPMRAPDSSPALGLGEAFAIDACGVGTRQEVWGNPHWINEMLKVVERRDSFLQSNGLLTNFS